MQISFRKLIVAATFSLAIIGIAVAQTDTDLKKLKDLADKGYADEQLKYGKMLNDQGNFKEAEKYLKKAADNKDKNDTEAAYLLGLMYFNGDLGTPNYEKAKEYFEKVEKNDIERQPEANYYIGMIYYFIGDPTNFTLYLGKSGDKDYLPAQQWLAEYYQQSKDPKDISNYMYWSKKAAENGDNDRILKLVDDYLAQNNKEEAIRWLKKSADLGNIESAYKVGMMDFNGEGGTPNYPDALKYLQQAADGGNTEADYYVGLSYLYGIGTKSNPNIASNYFAKDGNSFVSKFCLAVCSRLGAKDKNLKTLSYGQLADLKEAYNPQFKSFTDETTKYAQDKYPTAQYVAGIIDSYGIGKNKDLDQAFTWFKKAADNQILPAMVDLGFCYEAGEGTIENMKEAIRWYKKAADADNGDPVAQCNLGLCYANGEGVTQDPRAAVKYYQLAADQGYAPAQCNLGYCYETGEGIGSNPQKAVQWYKKAADQGYAIAQCNLAYCYENGIGVAQKNLKDAVKYYQLAADQGNERALENLATIYSNIQKIDDTNLKTAAPYLKRIVENKKGNAQVYYLLGYCYYNGLGIDKNMKDAVYYYKLAANQGNTKALNALVNYYVDNPSADSQDAIKIFEKAAQNGNTIAQYQAGIWYDKAKDYTNALRYFKMAADAGSDMAQYQLGRYYEEGKNMKQDLAEAMKWYKKSADQGNVQAKKALDNLSKRTQNNSNSQRQGNISIPNAQNDRSTSPLQNEDLMKHASKEMQNITPEKGEKSEETELTGD